MNIDAKAIARALLEHDPDEIILDGEEYTRAEYEDHKRIQAARAGRERQLRKNPQAAFREMFPTFRTAYANFPLPLLAFIPFEPVPFVPFKEDEQREKRARFKERLCEFICDYALVRVADQLYSQQKFDVMKLAQPSKPPVGYDASQRLDRAVGAAMVGMNRKHADMDRLTDVCLRSRAFLKEHNIQPDETARVQISLALLAADNPELSERDLRVLMAVNSSCGEQGWYQVSHTALAMRAVGAFTKEMVRRFGVKPLTRRQVQEALVKLREKGLIHFGFSRRRKKTYVGNASMLTEDTWERIVDDDLNKPKTAWRKSRSKAVDLDRLNRHSVVIRN